MAERLKARAV